MTHTLVRFNLASTLGDTDDRTRLHAEALTIAAAADTGGIDEVTFSEHHATASGSCTSPLLAAAGALAATTRCRVSASAVLVPLYDPVRLAEDLAFLDVAHPGRLRVTAGLGYRAAEYEWLGRPFSERGTLMDTALASIRNAWPALGPRSPLPEILAVGGQTVLAARRAVRHGLPFAPRAHLPELAATHAVMCAEAGVEAHCWMPSSRFLQVHVADDPDEAWARVGRWYLHDVREYAGWQSSGPPSPVFSGADDTDSLRRSGAIHVVTPEQCVALATDRPDTTVCLHPLAGGMSTDDAWAGVQCFIDRVLPQLAADPASRFGAAPDPGGDHGP